MASYHGIARSGNRKATSGSSFPWLSLALVGTWLCGQGLYAAEPIAPDQFRNLQALIKPGPGEADWEKVPWLTSLWEARKQAAAKGKPILLWEMDGHPLGCV